MKKVKFFAMLLALTTLAVGCSKETETTNPTPDPTPEPVKETANLNIVYHSNGYLGENQATNANLFRVMAISEDYKYDTEAGQISSGVLAQVYVIASNSTNQYPVAGTYKTVDHSLMTNDPVGSFAVVLVTPNGTDSLTTGQMVVSQRDSEVKQTMTITGTTGKGKEIEYTLSGTSVYFMTNNGLYEGEPTTHANLDITSPTSGQIVNMGKFYNDSITMRMMAGTNQYLVTVDFILDSQDENGKVLPAGTYEVYTASNRAPAFFPGLYMYNSTSKTGTRFGSYVTQALNSSALCYYYITSGTINVTVDDDGAVHLVGDLTSHFGTSFKFNYSYPASAIVLRSELQSQSSLPAKVGAVPTITVEAPATIDKSVVFPVVD
ncbi:MAG: hypothetical protein IJ680_09220 [Paludibacteraceae bacterium]|nr:hypothetical protein [Paludibacteraceae bacterium]